MGAGLSLVASGVGKPPYQDAITRECGTFDYARVCILLQYESTLPEHVVIIAPSAQGDVSHPIKIDIEYAWIPPKCTACKILGHSLEFCPNKKAPKRCVQVYVPKPIVKSYTEMVDKDNAEVVHTIDYAIPKTYPPSKM
ncbi:hypothetical protein Sango_2053900 [Sesamum angolense]|uniref:Zinc knuckle CX2CX4HX4C domain-containing protein n=1 Tax=Sesamum angolense TaxID=2727404 RepID=A0AAE1WGM7_9LAMI|nr:hypothetical protein Sango_2053900 [Sesamum angolense]